MLKQHVMEQVHLRHVLTAHLIQHMEIVRMVIMPIQDKVGDLQLMEIALMDTHMEQMAVEQTGHIHIMVDMELVLVTAGEVKF